MSDRAKEILKGAKSISGIGNLKAWSDKAEANSYHADKDQLRHNIGTEGASHDLKGDWVKGDDWRVRQKREEGRGWVEPINVEAKPKHLHRQGRQQAERLGFATVQAGRCSRHR